MFAWSEECLGVLVLPPLFVLSHHREQQQEEPPPELWTCGRRGKEQFEGVIAWDGERMSKSRDVHVAVFLAFASMLCIASYLHACVRFGTALLYRILGPQIIMHLSAYMFPVSSTYVVSLFDCIP